MVRRERHGLKFFLLGKGWMSYSLDNQAWRLVKTWPNIVKAAHNARGEIFEVSSGSSLKVEPKRG